MFKLPHFKAVIFDLDGLVIDSEPLYFAAWQQTLQVMGYPCPISFCQSLSGLPADAIVAALQSRYGGDFSLSQFSALSKQCWQHSVNERGIPVKPGFLCLQALLVEQNIPFALATNSPRHYAQAALEHADLANVFSLIAAREQVNQGKPAPDLFLLAAQQLTTPIHDCLVLEDSYHGVLAAHRAGAPCIYIPSTSPDARGCALAHTVADDLQQVANALSHLIPKL